MAVMSEVQVEARFEALAEKKPVAWVVLDLMRRKPLGAAGAIIVIIMILMAALADIVSP